MWLGIWYFIWQPYSRETVKLWKNPSVDSKSFLGSQALPLEERKVGQLCEVMVNSQAGTDTWGADGGRTGLHCVQVASQLMSPKKAPQPPTRGWSQKRASFWPKASNFYPQILRTFNCTLPGPCPAKEGFRNEQVITLTSSLENVWHKESWTLPNTTNQFPWSQGALCTM